MWEKVFRYFAILHGVQFAFSNETTAADISAVIIKEVCVPHQIAELERYLEEHDLPEVPISNTATYSIGVINDHAGAAGTELDRLSALGKIELLPFGRLPVDWKRLRLLHDLLILPEDQELKRKLFSLLKILLAANQRLWQSANEDKYYSTTPEDGTNDEGSTAEFTPGSKNAENSNAEPKEKEGIFFTPKSIEVFENTGTASLTTTTRHRLQRSTNTDSSKMKYNAEESQEEDFSSFYSGTETDLNIEGFSEAPDYDDTNWSPKLKNGISQLEEIEKKFEDGEFGAEVKKNFEEVAVEENHDTEEDAGGTDSSVEKTATESNSIMDENLRSTEAEKDNGKAEDKEDYENSKPGEQLTSKTMNQTRSDARESEEEETTEEIKPDERNEDLETIGTFSQLFTSSPSLSLIDEKSPGKLAEISSPTFSTAAYSNANYDNHAEKAETSTSVGEKNDETVSEIYTTVTSEIKNFPMPKKTKKEKEDEGESSNSVTKSEEVASGMSGRQKTFPPKVVESFSNHIPGRVELILIKNGDKNEESHVSRVHNFDDGRSSGVDSSPEYNFYEKHDYRLGQKSPRIFYRDKLQGLAHLIRPAASLTGRHQKRGGINTDFEKLYRWFYRGEEGPEKSDQRGDIRAVIKCSKNI